MALVLAAVVLGAGQEATNATYVKMQEEIRKMLKSENETAKEDRISRITVCLMLFQEKYQHLQTEFKQMEERMKDGAEKVYNKIIAMVMTKCYAKITPEDSRALLKPHLNKAKNGTKPELNPAEYLGSEDSIRSCLSGNASTELTPEEEHSFLILREIAAQEEEELQRMKDKETEKGKAEEGEKTGKTEKSGEGRSDL